MRRKTKLMRAVEAKYNRPLERLLPEMYNEMGLPRMAEEFGVRDSTVWYWMLRFGVNLRKVALTSYETL